MSDAQSAVVSVPQGHVAFILLYGEDASFYLEIPLDVINSLCLRPRKYLVFLGWCILGVEGVLALEHDGEGIGTDGNLDNQGIYYYVADADADLVHAVDIEVIKTRTNVPSESTQTRDDFRDNLLQRDLFCAWTGVEPLFGDDLHIIPFKRGSEWFRLIVENRPAYSEDVTSLHDINDIRNGIFAATMIHNGFDPRHAAILKTPNHILKTADIPPRYDRTDIPESVNYPSRSRYTLQWLVPPSANAIKSVPNNSDATFKKNTRKSKPSDLLLHYNYGTAAVKCWGRGTDVLQRRAHPPRPGVPALAPAGPSTTTHDRTTTIQKLESAWKRGGPGAGNSTAGTGKVVESEGQTTWDEDEVVLFFWGNSQAAKERHFKKLSENTRRMEDWREGVLRVPV